MRLPRSTIDDAISFGGLNGGRGATVRLCRASAKYLALARALDRDSEPRGPRLLPLLIAIALKRGNNDAQRIGARRCGTSSCHCRAAGEA